MEFLVTVVSVMVILCLIGAMLFTTRAFRARKANDRPRQQENLRIAGICIACYAVLNILRLYLEGSLF